MSDQAGVRLRSLQEFCSHVSSIDYQPKTIIDVGVAWGTPELYDQFPNAYFVLIEALPIFEKHLQRICKRVSGEYHLMAVGDENKVIVISLDLDPRSLAGANVIDQPTHAKGEATFQVTMATIDRILLAKNVEDGALLKLDVQGADLRALTGATKTLKKCELVIVEASFFNPKNKVRDIINYMYDHGFEIYEILGGLYRPYDNAQGQVDLAFVRQSSNLIAHKFWN